MIIAISGKIGSGKDLTGKIIQILTCQSTALDNSVNITEELIDRKIWDVPKFSIEKFGAALKDIVCILLNCTRAQLEDREFKNKELGEEWWYWLFERNGCYITQIFPYNEPKPVPRIREEDLKLIKLTPRKLLQLLGTECGRNIIHPNIWINALFSRYRNRYNAVENGGGESNWCITDVRFPNEYEAVKRRGGIVIRLQRYPASVIRSRGPEDIKTIPFNPNDERHLELLQGEYANQHESENALDFHQFDYIISNNDTIDDLVKEVKKVLTIENLI